MGTSGGNHAQCLDIGEHVTGTFEGSGASATRTRRTVPRAGTPVGRASPDTSLSPCAFGCSGGRGWGHKGAIRAGAGGQLPGSARAVEGETVPSSAYPTCAHPQGPGEDTADWDFGVRGQVGPGRRTRGVGGHL